MSGVETAATVQRLAADAVTLVGHLNAVARAGSIAAAIAAADDPEPLETYAWDHGLDRSADLSACLEATCLEVSAAQRLTLDGSAWVESIRIVFGTGGPHYEATVYPSGAVAGRAHWGDDTAEAHGTGADVLAEMLLDWFAQVEVT